MDFDVDRARTGWWAIAVALAAALAYTVYSFVGTFVLGVFIYYATRPVYRRLHQWVRQPTVAAVIALVTLALPAMLLAAYTTAVGLQELDQFLTAQDVDLGQVGTLIEPYLDVSSIVQDPEAFLNQPSVQDALRTTSTNALEYVGVLGTLFIHLFAVIIIAFYLLRDDHRLGGWFQRRFTDGSGVTEAYARAVDHDLSTVFFGNILFAFATGIIAAVSYGTMNAFSPADIAIPYPVLLGLITGIASLIPVIGIKLVWIPLAGWLAFVAFQNGTGYAFVTVFVLVAAVVVDFIPDLLLRPYVSGRNLHLGLVILSYVFGPLLWGWYGLFLGPLVLVFLVHFVRLVLPELLAGREIEPAAVGGSVWTNGHGSEQASIYDYEEEDEDEE
ncbi:AI-2E family transporter [Halobacterium sp. R2-5]|uniref:AI-2E family transporter n=1 Tax=Halobacterium sp. R2-5 TaxID=2715751 RepID=UPI00141E420A|nr:AI-2E family transporter [Halobacterium sp. R2-5]NIC00460.1 AI-2E family transporter [Halobacterium sp. R2-5]